MHCLIKCKHIEFGQHTNVSLTFEPSSKPLSFSHLVCVILLCVVDFTFLQEVICNKVAPAKEDREFRIHFSRHGLCHECDGMFALLAFVANIELGTSQ